MSRFVFDSSKPPAPPQSGSSPSPDEPFAHLEHLLRGAQSAAELRHRIALLNIEAQHRLAWHNSHFNRNQPRVPAGHSDGGQWTNASGVSDSSDGEVISDVTPDNDWRPGAQYANSRGRGSGSPIRIGNGWIEPEGGGQEARLAFAEARARDAIARVRAFDPTWRPNPSASKTIEGQIDDLESQAAEAEARLREIAPWQLPPIIPKQRPGETKEQNIIARQVANWLAEKYGRVIEGPRWLEESEDAIKAFLDPPKTLEELQRGASARPPGYDIHHIVEQTPARDEKFPETEIEGPANRVLVPRYRHWEITAWYNRKNDCLGSVSPRNYLRGKDWNERVKMGLEALIKHGVLKP
jgi:hypothetical protein